jgi:hypothetical protein
MIRVPGTSKFEMLAKHVKARIKAFKVLDRQAIS